jgi:hypothetical protein
MRGFVCVPVGLPNLKPYCTDFVSYFFVCRKHHNLMDRTSKTTKQVSGATRISPSQLPDASHKLVLQHLTSTSKKAEKFSEFCNKNPDQLGKPGDPLRKAAQQRQNYLLKASKDRPRLFVQILNKFRIPVPAELEVRLANLSSSSSSEEDDSENEPKLDTAIKKTVAFQDTVESSSSDEAVGDISGFESDSSTSTPQTRGGHLGLVRCVRHSHTSGPRWDTNYLFRASCT